MKRLTLTTPYIEHADVRKAQKALKENKFKKFYDGEIDGVYGPRSARATRAAKYWTGYTKRSMNNVYGDGLHKDLLGKTKLNLVRKRRVKARKRKARRKPLREKAFALAIKQEGIKESPPNSNRVKFSEWYGMIGPWCAMYVTWCYVQAGAKNFSPKNARWAYCPYMLADARASRNGLDVTYSPKRGDIVLFDWTKDGISDHVGLFDEWTGIGNQQFRTVEGNTSSSSNSNGGEVQRRIRDRSQVAAFVRVHG